MGFAAVIVLMLFIPAKGMAQQKSTSATWDVQFSYPMTGFDAQQCIAWDGDHFDVGRFTSPHLLRFDTLGNYTGTLTIDGINGYRDLTWDGQWLFALSTTSLLYQIDIAGQSLVSTVQLPVSTPRYLAYDHQQDAFWIGVWPGDFTLVTREGTMMVTYAPGGSVYGVEYDDFNDGLYLWFLTIDDIGFKYFQVDMNTGLTTGLEHYITEFGINSVSGIYIDHGIHGQTTTIGGIVQSTPPRYFGYELYGDPTGIEEPEENKPSVFPNPAGNELKVSCPGTIRSLQLQTLRGSVIYSDFPAVKTATIDLHGIIPGIYFVLINSYEKQWIEKVIVK